MYCTVHSTRNNRILVVYEYGVLCIRDCIHDNVIKVSKSHILYTSILHYAQYMHVNLISCKWNKFMR